MGDAQFAENDAQYPYTVETRIVHLPTCRHAHHGLLTWPRWGHGKARACSVCLPNGLPATRVIPPEGTDHG